MYTRSLTDLRITDVATAGGKGASLGELLATNIPVPPGFVVTTHAFKNFLQHNRITAPTAQNILKLPIPRILQQHILADFAQLNSPFVAVRSSATAEDGAAHAWAGQLESYVPTTAGNVLENIKKCWASLYSPRAIQYRTQAGLANADISVAVVVQKLVDSEMSGIAFSAHPVTGNTDHIVIEMVYGLGEAAVGGHETPHTYVLSKASGDILELYEGSQQKQLRRSATGQVTWQPLPKDAKKLTPGQLQELASHIRAIETHFGFACDVEWAHQNGTFHIVQSRPITTLK